MTNKDYKDQFRKNVLEINLQEWSDKKAIEWLQSLIYQVREDTLSEVKWYLFDTGKFTNQELLDYKKKFNLSKEDK